MIPDEHYNIGGNVWAFRNYLSDRRIWMVPTVFWESPNTYAVADDFGDLRPTHHRPEVSDAY